MVSVACVEVRVSQNYARAREVACVARPSRLVRWASVSAVAALSMAAGAAFAQTTLPEVTVEAKKQAKKSTPPKKAATGGAVAAPKAAVPQVAETATSPVKGYVAERSATGTKTDTPLKETPASISVVGAEQMRDQGVQNLQEAVRYTPGVNADSFGFDSRSDNVRDPRRAGGLLHRRAAHHLWASTPRRAMIEPYALERVEVLRGPAAMLYGQTPAGGIINGVSKLPSAIAYNEVSLEYGSYNHRALKIDSTGPLTTDGKWLYRITGLARNADTQVDFVENDRYMIQPSITYKPNLDTTVTLLVNLRKDDSGSVQQFGPIQGTLEPVPGLGRMSRNTFLGEPGDFYNTEQQSVSLLFDHKFNSALSMHHGMRYTHTDVAYDTTLPLILTPYRLGLINSLRSAINPLIPDREPNALCCALGAGRRALASRSRPRPTIFNSDTYLTAKLDTGGIKHKVTAGFDYMRYSSHSTRTGVIDNLLTDPSFPVHAPFNIFNPVYGQHDRRCDPDLSASTRPTADRRCRKQLGAYIQDQIKLGPWIGIVGVRHDWLRCEPTVRYRDQASAVTWRGGLMYETKFGLTPYVSYSQSFTPQLGTTGRRQPLYLRATQRTACWPARRRADRDRRKVPAEGLAHSPSTPRSTS